MQPDLVSILTPCYNTGTLVHRLLDSVLMQDYPLVEMFCIDDGSEDNTRDVVESYIPKFLDKGYSLTYIYQDNAGQSVAINNGLKMVHGEYLMWPDSDDYYIDYSIISKLVSKIRVGGYAMGRCRIQYVDEEKNVLGQGPITTLLQDENQFNNFITGRNGIAFPPIAYIIDLKIFDKVVVDRNIYTEKSAGQNWQIMLPMSYKQKCFYLSDIGANVLERANSHSRGQFSGYERTIEKMDVYERTVLATLNRMVNITQEDFLYYTKDLQTACAHNKMVLNIQYYKTAQAFAEYNKLEHKKRFLFFCACCLSLNKWTYFLMRIYLKLSKKTI